MSPAPVHAQAIDPCGLLFPPHCLPQVRTEGPVVLGVPPARCLERSGVQSPRAYSRTMSSKRKRASRSDASAKRRLLSTSEASRARRSTRPSGLHTASAARRENSSEHAERREQPLVVIIEEVVAPVHRCAEGTLALRQVLRAVLRNSSRRSRRSRIASGGNTRTWAAASSIASGTPSSAVTIRPRVPALLHRARIRAGPWPPFG